MPNTPNVSLPYPTSTDYVANGYLDIENLATAVDNLYGATVTYTPTLTNVTGGATTGQYLWNGKWLIVWATITAGTATAAGTVAISLPAGITSNGYLQPCNGMRGSAVASAYVSSNSTTITCTADAAGNNFTLGQTVSTYRVSALLEVQ